MPARTLLSRLQEALKAAPSKRLKRLIRDLEREHLNRDQILNGLMASFSDTRSVAVYTLLYELNSRPFLSIIFSNLRRFGSLCDPQDIMQEVFLSIYRYPGSFRDEKEYAFRNWSLSIIRNAIFKYLKRNARHPSCFDFNQDLMDDSPMVSPVEKLIEQERRHEWGRIYCLSLSLYLSLYNTVLKEREKEALYRVEVENLSYKVAAESMGIKPENFKMVICRARKKIFNAFQASVPLPTSRVMKSTG
jgi:RNA polymerase sigma factor (sigma-70 family)